MPVGGVLLMDHFASGAYMSSGLRKSDFRQIRNSYATHDIGNEHDTEEIVCDYEVFKKPHYHGFNTRIYVDQYSP